MNTFLYKLRLVVQDASLLKRILFVIAMLTVFRLGAAIPVPGVNVEALERFLSGNQFFGFLNIFSGGGLSNLSIFMLGVGPFITASIILQLLSIMIPSLKEMWHESGEAGRRQFVQYSRLLTVPLAVLQGWGFLTILATQGVLSDLGVLERLLTIITITAGCLLLMWIGELISEYGIGNGVSLIIFAGILAGVPSAIGQIAANFDIGQLPIYLAALVATIVIIAGIVFVTEAERPIPVTHAKQIRGNKVYGGASTYLPVRLNQAGVMPIIFALSILLFPQMIANFLTRVNNDLIRRIAEFVLSVLGNQWIYALIYFIFVFAFTYFYSAITFDPEAVATNLQRSGAFIPGIRPGRPTAEYVAKVLYRLTLIGALFLGIVAMLPLAMQAVTGIAALAIGGTSLLIVVSVALEFTKQVDAQLTMREY